MEDFVELHGDRRYGDDPAIVTGLGRIGPWRLLIIGHNKGRPPDGGNCCRFGSAHPEGFRKALAKMKLAEKFDVPVLSIIDTPGACSGQGAEMRGQAHAVACNLREMSRLRVPILVINIGEGGSGGALGIGVGDHMAMMQYSYYSVISPEGCAEVLCHDIGAAVKAASVLRLTSRDAVALGLADATIPEPLGGAHRNPTQAIHNVWEYILKAIKPLCTCARSELIRRRYARLRAFGSHTVRMIDKQDGVYDQGI